MHTREANFVPCTMHGLFVFYTKLPQIKNLNKTGDITNERIKVQKL